MPDPDDDPKPSSKPLSADAPEFVPSGDPPSKISLEFLKTAGLGELAEKAAKATGDAGTTSDTDAEAKSKARVEATGKLPDDASAAKGLKDQFKEGAKDPEFAKAATAKLAAIRTSVTALGRDAASSTHSEAEWKAERKKVFTARRESAELRKLVKAQLAQTDLDEDVRKELKAMADELDQTLTEMFDMEPCHGPTNHVKISRDAIGMRVMTGKNPRTGEYKDKASRATKFADSQAFLDVAARAEGSKEFDDALKDKLLELGLTKEEELTANDWIPVKLPLKTVFGDDYLTRVEGKTLIGSAGARNDAAQALDDGDAATAKAKLANLGVKNTDFKDGFAICKFVRIDDRWELGTAFPQVRASATNTSEPIARTAPAADEDSIIRYNVDKGEWEKEKTPGDWKPWDIESRTWA